MPARSRCRCQRCSKVEVDVVDEILEHAVFDDKIAPEIEHDAIVGSAGAVNFQTGQGDVAIGPDRGVGCAGKVAHGCGDGTGTSRRLQPADETNERVSDPFWACAGALAKIAMAENSAKPNICDFMAIPLQALVVASHATVHYCSEGKGNLARGLRRYYFTSQRRVRHQSGMIISRCVNLRLRNAVTGHLDRDDSVNGYRHVRYAPESD